MTRVQAEESPGSFRGWGREFSLLPDRLWGPIHHPVQLIDVRVVKRLGHETDVSYLLPMSRMRGAVPPLPPKFSWRGLELQLCFFTRLTVSQSCLDLHLQNEYTARYSKILRNRFFLLESGKI